MINRKFNDIDDELEEEEILKLMGKRSKVVTRVMAQSEHIYRIDYMLQSFEQSEELVKLLLTVPTGDQVRIYINSVGGSLDVADWIVQRIEEAKVRGVTVVAELGITVASGATYIALSCDDIITSPHTQFLIHNWSGGGTFGAATHSLKDAEFNKKQSDRWTREVYSGFLTETEIQDLIDNPKDLQFSSEEVEERWDNRLKFFGEDSEPNHISLDELIRDKVNAFLSEKEEAQKPTPKKKTTTKTKG